MALKAIKNKIRSVDKTHKVTKAMEAVSAVKMRKSQERALSARPYARAALTILKNASGSIDAKAHPLLEKRAAGVSCLVVITSDKGLAGSLNSAVLRMVRARLNEPAYRSESTTAICIGKRGYEFLIKRGVPVLKHYNNVGDGVSVDEMKEVTAFLVERFLKGDIARASVVYTNFRSTFEQEACVRKLLPISFDALSKIVSDIAPEKGKYAAVEKKEPHAVYTVEPNPEDVFAELLPLLLNIELYHMLLEAKASEHSARMVAMKNASDKAEEMRSELTLAYNQERQTLITRETSEIVGGVEALA